MKKEDGKSEEGMRDCLRDREVELVWTKASELVIARRKTRTYAVMHMMSRNVGKHAG